MNQHKQIVAEMARQYDSLTDAILISPSSLAYGVYQSFCTGDEEPHIQYTSVEQFKQMARDFLRSQKDPDSDANAAHGSQGDFGFKRLQDRYPLPRKAGEEPVYKLRHLLTPDERGWNVAQLRKSADARNAHADALEAEGQIARSA